jgi:hypothetical protein
MVSERIGSDPIGVIKEDLLKKLRGVRRQLGEGIQLRLVSRCPRTDGISMPCLIVYSISLASVHCARKNAGMK